MRKKLLLMMAAILMLVVASGLGLASDVGVPTVAIDDSPQASASVDPLVTSGKVTTILYDDFSQDLPVGVYVPDPNGKWCSPSHGDVARTGPRRRHRWQV